MLPYSDPFSLSAHTEHTHSTNLSPSILISKEMYIVLQAQSHGLPRPPMESDENLAGKPQMLLSPTAGH